jgi:hypothetical protein
MQTKSDCPPVAAETAKASQATPPLAGAALHAPSPFTGFDGLVHHLPMYGERRLRQMVKDKLIPSIRPPGSRKLTFHLPSVDSALLRYQRGGIE